MPVTLRRRLECHYCGKRLNTTKRDGCRIPCDQCSADNYFDANNNVIDVPENEVNRPNFEPRVPEVESESDIFCKKCLTNQAFFVQALSNYLPDESDPQYERLLKELPAYEKELELRYPQCCAQCEPRATARIQEANYMAKSDHLRRVIQSQHDRRRSAQQNFSSLLISAAGFGQAASLGIQLLWHALSSQVNSQHIVLGVTPLQCLGKWPVPAQCTSHVASFLPASLFVGLLCIWWNPRWQHRLKRREGRLTGLSKYYQVQIGIMAIRFVAWAVLDDLPVLQRNAQAVHTLLLTLLSTTSIYALTNIVEVDTTPLVDWQQVQLPLVRPDQFRPPSLSVLSPPSSQETSKLNIHDSFRSPAPTYEPWRPPTPPTENDSMDWAPTEHNFNPQPRLPKSKFEQQSPFYGTLPAAPIRGSLNAKAPPPPPQRKALGLPPGFFGLSKSRNVDQQLSTSEGNASDAFAPAKFFPNKRETDTGLENIFDKMFSVRDPLEISTNNHNSRQAPKDIFGRRRMSSGQRSGPQARSISGIKNPIQPPIRMVLSCMIIIALAVAASSLCSLEYLSDMSTSTSFRILPYTAAIPIIHLLEEARYTRQIEVFGLVVFALEISIAIATHYFVPASGTELVPMWNRMVIGAVCFFMLQEIYHFCQLQSTPMRDSRLNHDVPDVTDAPDAISSDATNQHHLFEETATSQPSPQQQWHAPPAQIQNNPFPGRDLSSVRKRDSDESISSMSSINTTSTASGWKTPQNTGRTFDWQSSDRGTPRTRNRVSNGSLNFGGLSLGNDFGTGANITGPRNRQAQGNGTGRYRY